MLLFGLERKAEVSEELVCKVRIIDPQSAVWYYSTSAKAAKFNDDGSSLRKFGWLLRSDIASTHALANLSLLAALLGEFR